MFADIYWCFFMFATRVNMNRKRIETIKVVLLNLIR